MYPKQKSRVIWIIEENKLLIALVKCGNFRKLENSVFKRNIFWSLHNLSEKGDAKILSPRFRHLESRFIHEAIIPLILF